MSNDTATDIATGQLHHPPHDFSLVLGGPLYQLFLRLHLSKPALELVQRRIIAFIVITWVPLLVLSALAGDAFGGVTVPFLRDVSAHARFLVALPLMIGAELIVHMRIRAVVQQFEERGLIAPEDEERFDRAIKSAVRWRNSVAVEVVMLVLAFTLHWAWSQTVVLHVETWYGHELGEGARQLKPAGYWYAFVSLPVFRFILMRWYYRLLIWYRFVWSMSRMKLQLNPLHPDRCGGLAFISHSAIAFLPVLVAQSALFSGILGERILHEGAKLPAYYTAITFFVASLLAIALAPMLCFAPQLDRSRRAGQRRYGAVASQYVNEFDRKWIAPNSSPTNAPGNAPNILSGDEPLLGTGDIQSLADLGNSFEVVREMQLLPIGRKLIVQMTAMILLPIAPLILTIVPLGELIQRLIKMAV